MNAVIYARYSSDSQREESIEGQLRECREYAERNNMTIVGTYIDRALSAKTADRPEFQHMIKDSAKELFEIVLVWKLDRFSRDRYDSAHYKHILKKNGVKVISAKEHISEGPEGIILEAMLEGYAEFYSAELSEKIHRGQKENALKGKNNGGGVPLGYLLDKKAQKLVIDPVTAPLVVEIFEKYADGKSVRSIVEDFNTRGLKTKKGQPFNINSFSSLLKNRKYIGEYRYQDVVIEGGVPAIVPEDLFNRVQERMEKNRHAPAMAKAKEDYLLTTKLFCGKCERMMVGESGKSHTGAMHYYYKCSGAKRLKDCDKKAVRKDWIERVVVRLTMQRVMDEEKINRLIDAILVMQEQEDTTTPALRSQLAETESSIGNILKAIEQGIFTPSTKQRLDELEARKEEILVNIQTAELQKPKLTREQMTAWFEQFRHGDPANREFQKRLIDTFVNAVYVFDDKLVLTYNYQHGTQTISLDEIASALSSDFDWATPPIKKPRSLNGCGVFLVFARAFWLTCLRITCDICKLSSVKTRLLQMLIQDISGCMDNILICVRCFVKQPIIYGGTFSFLLPLYVLGCLSCGPSSPSTIACLIVRISPSRQSHVRPLISDVRRPSQTARRKGNSKSVPLQSVTASLTRTSVCFLPSFFLSSPKR